MQIRTISLIIFMLGLSLVVKASPQIPDFLIYNDDTIATYNLILEQYLQKKNEPDKGKLFGFSFRNGASTYCWRGYQAVYKIENDSLFLTNILNCGELYSDNLIDIESSRQRMREIFDAKLLKNKVFIDWFTGYLSVPKGDQLRWDGVFYRIFEKEILFHSKNGIITNISAINNYEDFPNRIDRRYKDTTSNEIFEELKKINWKKEYDCSERYLITINKEGKVSNVSMVDYQTKNDIREFWDKPEYKYCIKTIKSELKDLKFDIIKDKGVAIEEEIFIEVWIEDDGTLENWTN